MLKKIGTTLIVGMSLLNPVAAFAEAVTFTQTSEQSEEWIDSDPLADIASEPVLEEDTEESEESELNEEQEEEQVDVSSDQVEKQVSEEVAAEEIASTTFSSEEEDQAEVSESESHELVTGTWGTVPWTWDEETKTIELEAGDAGAVADAPWKTYTAVVAIIVNDTVVLPADSAGMFIADYKSFEGLTALERIENAGNFDISNIKDASYMFYGARSLTNLDVSDWDWSGVNNALRMFMGASLTFLDFSKWEALEELANMEASVSGRGGIYQMLSGVPLVKIKMGDRGSLRMTGIVEWVSSNGIYTGRWIQTEDALGNKPTTPLSFTLAEFGKAAFRDDSVGTYELEEKAISAPVTVKYLDTEGNQLSEPVILQGRVGNSYNSRAIDISGWQLIETPNNATGTYTEDAQEVIYVYEREDGLVTGLWGTVPWTWDEETKTIELEAGDAGTVADAPWRTYTSVVKIIVNDTVVFPADSAAMFSLGYSDGLDKLVTIENAEKIDMSNVTHMGGMFYGASLLTEVDVSNWDVSSVTHMGHMFEGAISLSKLDVSNWNVSSVTNMWGMFSVASSLTELDVSNWNVSNVTNMYYMFYGVSLLNKLDVSKWDVSNVLVTANMFQNASSLKELDLSDWDCTGVVVYEDMFDGTNSLEKLF